MAGNQMDEAVMTYLKRKYNLLVGERTAELIKITLGSAYPLDKPLHMEVKGRTLSRAFRRPSQLKIQRFARLSASALRPSSMQSGSHWSGLRRSFQRIFRTG